jgi:hypothetical protein
MGVDCHWMHAAHLRIVIGRLGFGRAACEGFDGHEDVGAHELGRWIPRLRGHEAPWGGQAGWLIPQWPGEAGLGGRPRHRRGGGHGGDVAGATRGITSRRFGVYGLRRHPAVVVCNQGRGRARGRRAPCRLGELSRRGHRTMWGGRGRRGESPPEDLGSMDCIDNQRW